MRQDDLSQKTHLSPADFPALHYSTLSLLYKPFTLGKLLSAFMSWISSTAKKHKQPWCNKCSHYFWRWMHAFWEHSSVSSGRQLYNTLNGRLSLVFQNDQNIWDPIVLLCKVTLLFDAHGQIYFPNAFPPPIICINYFLHKSKTTSDEHKNYFLFFSNLPIFQNAHKNRVI